ncbi:hypothetical protein SADUNF_Sadunf17G0108100 [Salix dunnii]|uniref:Serine aminopeptidase S33 domain-containing protein n=1 Tax=Salix dunnii TaxID=1413687 RepID=A0A835J3N0_9ROSI|nr:hypothetical protein SADUNF_Sadunf17G0108100 [Salix dunnii]
MEKFLGISDELQKVLDANMDSASERRRAREAFKEIQLGIDHCLMKVPDEGLKIEESYEVNSRGLKYFAKSWLPGNTHPKALVCYCHGYGETCTFVFEGIARKLTSSGYGVFAMDYPGFGLSDGLHGFIPSLDKLVDDVAEHYSKIKDNMIPPWLVKQILIGVAHVFPKLKIVPHQDFVKMAFRDLKKQELVTLPLLILHGEADAVTDPSVSKALYEKASSSDKKLKLYKDAYHSLLEGETDEMIFRVLNDIIAWLDEHSIKFKA